MNAILSVTINRSAEWIALSSSEMGQLCVWEWQSQTHVLKQQSHFGSMSSLAYSPDAQYIVTGGLDGKVNLWTIIALRYHGLLATCKRRNMTNTQLSISLTL